MTKLRKMAGILAVAPAIVFSFAGCDNPAASDGNSNNNSGGGNAYIGPKLELSGQVYSLDYTNADLFTLL